MEPTRHGRLALVDLLDRILDKGLILNADVLISLAGVPLVAVNLRAAIASVETMLEYGLMRDFIQLPSSRSQCNTVGCEGLRATMRGRWPDPTDT